MCLWLCGPVCKSVCMCVHCFEPVTMCVLCKVSGCVWVWMGSCMGTYVLFVLRGSVCNMLFDKSASHFLLCRQRLYWEGWALYESKIISSKRKMGSGRQISNRECYQEWSIIFILIVCAWEFCMHVCVCVPLGCLVQSETRRGCQIH